MRGGATGLSGQAVNGIAILVPLLATLCLRVRAPVELAEETRLENLYCRNTGERHPEPRAYVGSIGGGVYFKRAADSSYTFSDGGEPKSER